VVLAIIIFIELVWLSCAGVTDLMPEAVRAAVTMVAAGALLCSIFNC
jgi:hypothetical protein